ncbi:MAG: cell division protein ZapA [Nitrospinae bacterium]|nr:cell division protein ZapA [Nitrospinota bacterium]
MEPSTVKVNVYGREYPIKSARDPHLTQEYAAFVDAKMKEAGAKSGSFDQMRIAILALMQITHELFTLRAQVEKEGGEYEKRMGRLLEKIESSMSRGGIQTMIGEEEGAG